MSMRTVSLLIGGAVILWSGVALAQIQTAYLEGHVFDKRTGIPIEGAVVVITENESLGPLPFLLAEDVSDDNGFYQASVPAGFHTEIILVFCRTQNGEVVRGSSFAQLQEGMLRRRDIYLETPRRLRNCLDPEPGDIPRFRN